MGAALLLSPDKAPLALRARAILELRRRKRSPEDALQLLRSRRVIPGWAAPFQQPMRYKGFSGGRGSGKSHFCAEEAVEDMVEDDSLRFVCIREVQRSLEFSSMALIELKIRALGVADLFDIKKTRILRRGGSGLMIFEGMQDHTADSIK